MSSKTRAQDSAGTSRGREATPNPPPVPPTLAEAIATLVNATTDNTRFLREMAGQQMQQQGGRAYPQGPREMSYLDFSETRPPLFVKAEDPLEADKWIRIIEQKFGLLRYTEIQKPLFAAQQLRGPASTWWGNYVVVQPAGHQITWDEFKLAFREHYIPEGVLHMNIVCPRIGPILLPFPGSRWLFTATTLAPKKSSTQCFISVLVNLDSTLKVYCFFPNKRRLFSVNTAYLIPSINRLSPLCSEFQYR
jgi:hypothetical protein